MGDWTGYALLSLGTGALYVLVAAGVVVVARGAGVLNIAQGALVAWSAFAFHGAYERWGLPLVLAAVLAIASTAAIGFVFHVLVMRPLEDASPVVRLIATLGLMIILQSSLGLMYSGAVRESPSVLPSGTVTVAGAEVGAGVFVRLAVVAAVVAGLWAAYRYTTAGLATTAVSENPRAAATYGWSPNLVAGLSWCLGAGLAGLAGVLLAPLQQPLSAPNLAILVVPALAVALAARFRSFGVVLAGGLALGLVEVQAQVQLISEYPALRGVDRALPLLVIVFYLAVRGRGLPGRGHVAHAQPLLGSGTVHWRALGLLLAATLGLVWLVLPADWVGAINANALWAMLILSVVVLVGFTGQVSLGQLTFAGFAALIAGRLVAVYSWPLEAAFAVAVLATVPAGMLFALPALRTRGLQLAVVTLGLGAAVDAMLFQRGYHSPASDDPLALAFGDLAEREGTFVGEQSFLGVGLDKLAHPAAFATLSIVAFTLVALAVANLRRGRAGRRLIAVRTNERAAASLGISVVGAKMYAFALSAAIAGFGGVLYAFYLFGELGNIDYGRGDFSPFSSILLIAYAVVGGVGWVSGAFAGATLALGALATRLGAFFGDALGRLGWLLRATAAVVGGLVGFSVGRRLAQPPGRRPRPGARLAPWAGAAVLVALALAVGPKLAGWLAELDRYVPLIGGIVLVAVISRSDGGMAPDNARSARRALDARWPARAAARARRTVVAAVGESGVTAGSGASAVAPGASKTVVGGEAAAVGEQAGQVPSGHAVDSGRSGGAAAGGGIDTYGGLLLEQPDHDRRSGHHGQAVHRRIVGHPRHPRQGDHAGLVRPARLSVSGLTVRFGAVTALESVALTVEPGEVLGLIGPNGAGKTTAIDAITGYTPAPSAFMTLGGIPIDRMPAHRRAREGLARSFQTLELFDDLTVLENIQAACDSRDTSAYLTTLVAPRNRPLPAVALAAVDAFGLRGDLLRTVSELPYGRRRLLAVARAVAAGPSVLFLDEPCAGLDEAESAEVVALLRHLARDWGLGILLNEHDMAVVMEVCNRIVVLDAGKVIAQGSPERIRNNPRVRAAYLGDDVPSAPRRNTPPAARRVPGAPGRPGAPGGTGRPGAPLVPAAGGGRR